MSIRSIGFIIGGFFVALGMLMLVPGLYAVASNGVDERAFLISAAVSAGSGVLLMAIGRGSRRNLRSREMFVLTVLSWVAIGAFSALPLSFSVLHLSYTDAYFETISGLTTTGSTVLTGLDDMPRQILLWRALLQWVGGIGLVVMAIAVLPFLHVGGMRLFQTESSDKSDKFTARSASVAKSISVVYVGITGACATAYFLAGMNAFDAITHAMTTLATGGYANYDSSFGEFNSTIQWLAVVFMIAGGLPFVLYIRMLRGDTGAVVTNSQVRVLVLFLLVVVLSLTLWRWQSAPAPALETLRLVTFNVVSVVTTTGYATTDYNQWGELAIVAFFFLTFVGACSGSTSGGIKIFRFQIASRLVSSQLHQLSHPSGVFPTLYNDRPISDAILRSVVSFSFFYAVTVAVITAGLSLLGLDFLTAISGAATAVGNVGPGVGDIIGPAGNFSSLPDAAKWLLSLGMLMGRLEILTVLVLLSPSFWKG
ncbi:MAG: TrkH family potassium uptake protein [Gammaproteobacteria bacterium]